MPVIGIINPYGTKYRIHQYDNPISHRGNVYWITIQFCLGTFLEFRFKRNHTADFRSIVGFKQPSQFGRNWKGWFVQFLGIGIMMKKEIKE